MFRDYDTCDHEFSFSSPKKVGETPSLQKGRVLVDASLRRVCVSQGNSVRMLPASVYATEALHWKMMRQLTRQAAGGVRSEAYRGDPSRAQISASSLKFYEEWMNCEKEVAAAGEQPNHLSPARRKYINQKAHALMESMVLPMRVRSVVVYSFGAIPTNWSMYHSDKYIWPIGFK